MDHIFTNAPDKISDVQKLHWGGSDHMMIIAVRNSRSIKSSPKYARKRSYKNFNPDTFKMKIRQLGFLDIYLSDNVNTAVSKLTNKLNDVLNVMAPMKTIQIRQKYNPWISQETLNLMKKEMPYRRKPLSQEKEKIGIYL